MDILSTIHNVIKLNTILGDRVYEIGKSDNLLDHGLDSLQMMRVIVELERKFKFEFTDEELLMANFNSIKAISDTIESILNSRCALVVEN